jgi:hypothetical protein
LISLIWKDGTRAANGSRKDQLLNQNARSCTPVKAIYEHIFIYLIMEFQIGEPMLTKWDRIKAPHTYLFGEVLTQSLSKTWSMSQTSLPIRKTLTSLVRRIPRPCALLGQTILCQPTKLMLEVLKFFQIIFWVVWSM